MIYLLQQKHIALFDSKKAYLASFNLSIKNKTIQDNNTQSLNNQLTFSLYISHKFTFQWNSQLFDIKRINKELYFGPMPFSLQTYCSIYQDPRLIKFKITPKKQNEKLSINEYIDKPIGKLIIKTNFSGNPFTLPIYTMNQQYDCHKKITIITQKTANRSIICSAEFNSIAQASEVSIFTRQPSNHSNNSSINDNSTNNASFSSQSQLQGFLIYNYQANSRINSRHIIVMYGKFTKVQFTYHNMTVGIYTTKQQIEFIPNLKQSLSRIKSHMQLQNVTIIQGVKTDISDGYHVVFYKQTIELYRSLFRSYLYDKIREKWIIQGIVYFNRNFKDYQDSMNQLSDKISQGQQFYPLINQEYAFDQVWIEKAKVIYHILANLKAMADSGGRSLTNFIVQLSKKRKVTSLNLFKKLKNTYGLDSIKKIYYEQFISSIGLNKIFYQLLDGKKQNNIKIIVRQKALACKVFKVYNMFRIKLQQTYEMISPLTQRIMKKNNYDEKAKKKQLSGPLNIPKYIKCIPYFIGKLIIQLEGSQPFNFQLLQQNMMEKSRPSSSIKTKRPINRKSTQYDPLIDSFTWIMIDTAQIFPAVYQNSNVPDKIIQYMLKKEYQNQHQQLKVLNAISARDHTGNQNICKIMIKKLKIKPPRQNAPLSIKRKILSILPFFMKKATDTEIWEDLLGFLKLYQPICYDHSQQGSLFLEALIQCIGSIPFRKQYSYYFEQFHKIFLLISKYHRVNSQYKQQKLRMVICSAIMNWESVYSYDVIKEMKQILQLCKNQGMKHRFLLKIIVKNILKYFNVLKIDKNNNLLYKQTNDLINLIIDRDFYGQLYSLKFQIQTRILQQKQKSLVFLTQTFNRLQTIQKDSILKRSYPYCLEKLKDILNEKKKRYGLEIQVNQLNQNQNYFLAQYLWKHMSSDESINDSRIRLAWMKIYRIFYFYYTPIITFVKIKKNCQDPERKQFKLSQQSLNEIRNNIIDFNPDINWFSVYDSSGKAHKKKVQILNKQKRKKRPEQLNLSGNNMFTKFLKQNPSKNTWDQLGKVLLKWLIDQYENKDLDNPNQTKSVQSYLKRGNMPAGYNQQKLVNDTIRQLENYEEQKWDKAVEAIKMYNQTLSQIQQIKKQQQAQKEGTTKISLSKFLDIGDDQKKQEPLD